jgi:nitrogen fixation/metabolism regulation signal transduction histidine kinase
VVAEIDMAVFAFNEEDERWLSFVNPAAERLLDARQKDLLGRTAERLELEQWLNGPPAATVQHAFPGGGGPWNIRHRPFRQDGRQHVLLMVTDVSRALREEERKAWRRLIRVLGHEINNSLAPIKSTAATLAKLSKTEPEDWREDLGSGLTIIANRAEALARFMQSYTALARLPPPERRQLELALLARRVVALMADPRISLRPSAAVSIWADADQLEQALINLLKNAVDAMRESGGCVSIGWRVMARQVLIEVIDEGPGLLNTDNLFVPFFTTKPGGSGIGLALVRQIAEGHGGSIMLANREDRQGCVARLCLPL